MSRVEDAIQRLNAALDRLDKVVEARGGARHGDAGRLRAALDDARRRNEEVGALADQVATRVDRAVRRVDSILES